MLRDTSSADKLLEDGAQNVCGGLFLLGKKIVVESDDGNVFSSTGSLTAQIINNQGTIIC